MSETFEASIPCRDEPALDGEQKIRKRGEKKTRMLGCALKDNRLLTRRRKSRLECTFTFETTNAKVARRRKQGIFIPRGAWSLSWVWPPSCLGGAALQPPNYLSSSYMLAKVFSQGPHPDHKNMGLHV